MYCSSCGKKIAESSKFCKYCGVSQVEIESDKHEEDHIQKPNISKNPLKVILVFMYWSLGLFSFIMTIWSTQHDIGRVLSGEHNITNFYWYLGMIPIIFYIFYSIFLIIRNIKLKNIVRLLAELTSILFLIVVLRGYETASTFLTPLFSIITPIYLKNFNFREKKEKELTISAVYFRYFLASIFVFIELLVITILVDRDMVDNSMPDYLADVILIIDICLGLVSLVLGIFFRFRKNHQNKFFKILTNPKILAYKKVSFYILIFFAVIYLLNYLFAIITNALEPKEIKDIIKSEEVMISPTPSIIKTATPTIKVKPKTQNTTNTSNTGSQIECIGPDGVQFKTTMDECKKLNETWGKPVDYMVNCTISDLCVGGGVIKYLKKSECDKPCTRISTGTNTNSTTNNSNKVAFTTNYASVKGTYYCYESAINNTLNYYEKTTENDYKWMIDTCERMGAESSWCETEKDFYRESQSKLDSYIKQYCP